MCDLVGFPDGPRHHDAKRLAAAADVTVPRDFAFSWHAVAKLVPADWPAHRAVVLLFPAGKSFCRALDVDELHAALGDRPVVLMGPFGDGQNFGFVTGGDRCPSCKSQAELGGCDGLFEKWWCGAGSWDKLVRFLDDPSVLLWLTFSQTVDHPKLISIPLGVEARFHAAAMAHMGDTLRANKTHLVGVTFSTTTNVYGNRVNALQHIPPRDVLLSAVNPWSEKIDKGKRLSMFNEAVGVFQSSRVVIAPSGMGPDTKRPFEALLHGSVPLMERDVGLFKSYARLPALWSNKWLADVDGLRDAYVEVVCRREEYKWEKLTWRGWIRFIRDVAEGNAAVSEWF